MPGVSVRLHHLTIGARAIIGQAQRLVSGYLIGSTPRSLHIFFTRMSLISEWRGIADR